MMRILIVLVMMGGLACGCAANPSSRFVSETVRQLERAGVDVSGFKFDTTDDKFVLDKKDKILMIGVKKISTNPVLRVSRHLAMFQLSSCRDDLVATIRLLDRVGLNVDEFDYDPEGRCLSYVGGKFTRDSK